jgi:hypothetical protein
VTFSWTLTDGSGNTATRTRKVVVEDTKDPVLEGVPADAAVSCDNVPPVAEPTVSDACQDPTLEFSQSVEGDGVEHTITRSWTASDNCGHSVSAKQILEVTDSTKPTIVWGGSAPADEVVQCASDVPAAHKPWASDNCDSPFDVDYTSTVTLGNCAHSFTETRTWTATDSSGNQDSLTQTITVADASTPTLDSAVPSDDATHDCTLETPNTYSYSDNCGGSGTASYSTEADATGFGVTETWSAEDECGNKVTRSRHVAVVDSEPHLLTSPPPVMSVNCDKVDNFVYPAPTFTDECDANPTVALTTTETSRTRGENYVVQYLWTATDSCGNSNSFTGVLSVDDQGNPTLSGVPADQATTCRVPNPTAADYDVTAQDDCDEADPEISFQTESNFDCTNSGTITMTWTAVDKTGNVNSQSSTITVSDTEAPAFTEDDNYNNIKANPTVDRQCGVPAPLVLSASDNCDGAVLVNSAVDTSLTGPSGTVTRTYSTVDACGNKAEIQQQFVVEDTEKPSIKHNDDSIIECPQAPASGAYSADDNCDADLAVTLATETSPGTCAGSTVTTYTITATDDTGNTATASHKVTVVDTSKPGFSSKPGNEQLECDDARVPEDVSMTDICDHSGTTIAPEITTVDSTADNQIIKYTWVATDACGNENAHEATYTYSDNHAPTFSDSVPDAITAACDDVPQGQNRAVTDNCDDGAGPATPSDSVAPGTCEDEYTITRTWAASDRSGNEVSDKQVISVADNDKPVWTSTIADKTVECDESTDTSYTANDSCDPNVDVTVDESSSRDAAQEDGSLDSEYQLTRHWTASDRCGNANTVTQVITVEDTGRPTIVSGPDSHSAECKHVPDIVEDDIVFSDNCDSAPSVDCSESVSGQLHGAHFTLNRQCTVTDRAGNFAQHTWTVQVRDTTAPVVHGLPDDITVEMGGSEEFANCDAILALAQATDNCDANPELTVADTSAASDDDCLAVLRCVVTATDASGNQASATFQQTSKDTLPPVFDSYPENDAVECDSVPQPCDVATVGEDLAVTYSERTSGNQQIRTWTARDACGHQESHSQTVTISDSSAPVFSRLPADEAVACDCDTLPFVANLHAVDNCDDTVTVDVDTIKTDIAHAGEYKLIHTWTASDSKQNSVEHKQTITVSDTEAPVISMNEPETLSVSCEVRADLKAPIAFATDNCDEADLNLNREQTITGDDEACASKEVITYTWSASDDVGNTATKKQVITITDDNAPVATARTTSCLQKNGLWYAFSDWAALFGAEDACGTATIKLLSVNGQTVGSAAGGWKLSGAELSLKGDGVTQYEIRAEAADACDNKAQFTHTVAVQDGDHCLVGNLDLDRA